MKTIIINTAKILGYTAAAAAVLFTAVLTCAAIYYTGATFVNYYK